MELQVERTPIDGLLVVRLPLYEDARGWFRENWQRAKLTALGLPDFEPVQHNLAYNAKRGTTRGIHAEPWDKYVTVVTGRAFGAWVDLRPGSGLGTAFYVELNPQTAVFVPRGVGNSYQTLDDDVAYTYLVNDHFVAGRTYPALDLADPAAAIPWPIPLDEAEVSDKDRTNPRLGDVEPMLPKKTLITGANGQLGRALAAEFPDAETVGRDRLDITDPEALAAWPWSDYGVVLNAAAYTAVDDAETDDGRRAAWAANAVAPAALARIANEHRLTLVSYSTDYVYDGAGAGPEGHTEDEPLAPLGVYAQAKAAGDVAVRTAKRHYLLRTSWVIGEGRNFVRTMADLAEKGVSPTVVDDQVGRLTFADELARATRHLVDAPAPYGTYHVTNGGPAMSWAEVAQAVFESCGRSADDVTSCTTAEYAEGRAMAPRPLDSRLDLSRLRAAGFEPADAMAALDAYLS